MRIALYYSTSRGTATFVQGTDRGHNNKVLKLMLGREAVNDRAKWRQPC